MDFGKILGRKADTSALATADPRHVDAFAMVNGKPSNQQICEEMLEGEKDSPEATAYIRQLAQDIGFSEEEAKKFWG